jgi:hypothetical protein
MKSSSSSHQTPTTQGNCRVFVHGTFSSLAVVHMVDSRLDWLRPDSLEICQRRGQRTEDSNGSKEQRHNFATFVGITGTLSVSPGFEPR